MGQVGLVNRRGAFYRSAWFSDLERYGLCSPGETAEVFAVACPELEEGGGGLPAFQFQGINGRKIGRVGLVVGGDVVFGQTGRPPPVRAEAGARTPSPSGERGQANAEESAG